LLAQPDIRAIVSNYRDITERKTVEQEAQRQAERLIRFNAELEAFTYAVTHDLKEPLRSVSVFTELLVQRTQPDEETKELATFIVEGAQRMSALLDDLLSFTSLKAQVKLQRIGLRRAAERAIQNLDKIIRESSATVDLDPLPMVDGHPNHLMQLFQNLIGNAIKYRSEEPPRIHIAVERLGTECIIKVKDNGIGIPPEYREHVFGLFKRLHGREIPGTGIGLAICKKIVEGMGGRIWVEPNGDQGSAFCFSVTPVNDCLETDATFSLQSAAAQS
jgi:light-regulated signal transduction histidine kinase (bacteriophytochrome)